MIGLGTLFYWLAVLPITSAVRLTRQLWQDLSVMSWMRTGLPIDHSRNTGKFWKIPQAIIGIQMASA